MLSAGPRPQTVSPDSCPSRLLAHAAHLCQRQRLLLVGQALIKGLGLACLLAAITVMVQKWLRQPTESSWLLLCLVPWLASLPPLLKRADYLAAAYKADAQIGNHERFATAVALVLDKSASPSPMHLAAQRQGLAHLPSPKQAFCWQMSRRELAWPSIGILLMVLSLCVPATKISSPYSAYAQALANQPRENLQYRLQQTINHSPGYHPQLTELQNELSQLARPTDTQDSQQLASQLALLAQELKRIQQNLMLSQQSPDLGQQAAHQAQLAQLLDQLAQDPHSAANKAALQQLVKQLDKNEAPLTNMANRAQQLLAQNASMPTASNTAQQLGQLAQATRLLAVVPTNTADELDQLSSSSAQACCSGQGDKPQPQVSPTPGTAQLSNNCQPSANRAQNSPARTGFGTGTRADQIRLLPDQIWPFTDNTSAPQALNSRPANSAQNSYATGCTALGLAGAGPTTSPENHGYLRARQQAETAIAREVIPLSKREVVRRYYEGIDPRQ